MTTPIYILKNTENSIRFPLPEEDLQGIYGYLEEINNFLYGEASQNFIQKTSALNTCSYKQHYMDLVGFV